MIFNIKDKIYSDKKDLHSLKKHWMTQCCKIKWKKCVKWDNTICTYFMGAAWYGFAMVADVRATPF